VKLLTGFQEAASAARLIDCVWFQNGRMMPAVLEIEHSTGVASGLTRMKRFFDLAPAIRDVRWAIVAPDEDRQKVMEHANREQFREMRVKFFPYSAVEELYALCDRRKPKGISDAFLDCFMEECVL
jgi:type II restriction enzyme